MVEGLIEKGAAFDQNTIRKYENVLPAELIDIWKNYGYATLLDGYLRVINPDDYKELLDETYFRGNISIPILTTAFGDILTIEEGRYVGQVRYKEKDFDICAANFRRFMLDFSEKCFQEDYFRIPRYREAVERLGRLEPDECFGYVPLLGLGGSDRIENLKKVKMREHILINVHFLGGIGM